MPNGDDSRSTALARDDQPRVTPFGEMYRRWTTRRRPEDEALSDHEERMERLERHMHMKKPAPSPLGGASGGGMHEVRLVKAAKGASIMGTSLNKEIIVVTDSELQEWLSKAAGTGSAPSTASAVTAANGSIPQTPFLPPVAQGRTKYGIIYFTFATANNYRGVVTVTISWISANTLANQSLSVTVSLEDTFSAFWMIPYYEMGSIQKLDVIDIGPLPAIPGQPTFTPTAVVKANQLGVGIPAVDTNIDLASPLLAVDPLSATISALPGGSLPGMVVSAVALSASNAAFKAMMHQEHLGLAYSLHHANRAAEE